MSIPPLVCSTPPPPDQCEDDKDPEDFDLQYHLSQDDEENEFRYGNFMNMDSVHTCAIDSNNSLVLSKDKPDNNAICTEVSNHKSNIENPQIVPEEMLNPSTKISYEEDLNIEDLNLNVNEEPASAKENVENIEMESHFKDVIVNTSKDLQSDIPCISSDISQVNCKISFSEENTTSVLSLENPQVLEITEKLTNEVLNENIQYNSNLDFDDETDQTVVVETSCTIEDDFDEFQFTSSDDKPEMVMDSNDPWANINTDDVKFGDFTANFGDDDSTLVKTCPTEELMCTNISSETHTQTKNFEDCDDDFGDFDEFKCSSLGDKENDHHRNIITDNDSVPVLNIQSENEHQLIESINKVLQTIFQEEISESEHEICSNLDTSLGETWGYLKDMDNRQPYMVNWNNSLAQKTLLKALCIDSRNILFGPKWSSNMPKYAVNLSAAPLMPQKQVTQVNNLPNEHATYTDKSANKASWADPFTSDGQESCNVNSENTTIEAGPTDLDVFEATMSSKAEKIYSSTLNIQPMRQINLPDTHIFTPTDSETPRSKTIHYDTTHTILMPQPVTAVKNQMDSFSSQTIDSNNSESDEYWEFQNFKGSTDDKSPVNENVENKNIETVANKDTQPKPGYTYETQVLQPIKLEPTIPTLNWPNPGEVKETFEDFTDFISKSTPDVEKGMPLSNDQDGVLTIDEQTTIENKVFENASQKSREQLDDDFDMFQSALPTTKNISQSDLNNLGKGLANQNAPSFDAVFSNLEHVESDYISLAKTKPTENTKHNAGNFSKVVDPTIVAPPLLKSINDSNLLQPTPLTSSVTQQNHQKSGQILQPLSLESYSQINWPNPGIDLQDLSRFNPVESLHSLKSDSNNHSKNSSPIHNNKSLTNNQAPDDDIWGEFVSSFPKPQQPSPKKLTTFVDDDEWTDFVSSPSVNSHNGLNTISLNVHTNSNIQKLNNSSKYPLKGNEIQMDIPTLNYITPKTSSQKTYNDRHFQNL